jgi:DNA-binding NarL/FixJ family response regulator
MELPRRLLDQYFQTTQYPYTRHHLDSYNQFLESDLPAIIKSQNPLIILKDLIPGTSIYEYKVEIFIGGEDGSKMNWINLHTSIQKESFISVLNDLTDIQIETLRLVAQGLSNSEIAKVRFVSEKSVEQIVARIAHHLSISPDRRRNLRVALAGEYFKWLGAPRH